MLKLLKRFVIRLGQATEGATWYSVQEEYGDAVELTEQPYIMEEQESDDALAS